MIFFSFMGFGLPIWIGVRRNIIVKKKWTEYREKHERWKALPEKERVAAQEPQPPRHFAWT
jgi:hypothetical protein